MTPRDRERELQLARAALELPNGRRRKRLRERSKRRRQAVVLAIAIVLGLPLVLAAVGLGGASAFSSACNLSALRPVSIGQNSFVYAADGSLLGAIPAERNREPVRYDRISFWMTKATVAIEDRRFFEHGGIDYEGIARALVADLKAGRVVEGGSTITQQLVRNLYISRERTLTRKLKEACLAIKLSEAWPKRRILTAYMNQVYYGNHAYGVEAAAQTYFSRSAKHLTLAQAALLAGLPQAPSAYDPINRGSRAIARRNVVLRAMLDNGDITPGAYRYARSRALGLRPGRLYTRIREPYFFSYVREALIRAYGANTVRSGGLRVYTTIDPRAQQAARAAIRRTLPYRTDPAAAVVSIDPRNGAIRAMAAVTPGRAKNEFNLVAQARRQTGSAFKTFVLTAAVAKGMNPATTTYVSAPVYYKPPGAAEAWEPKNYDDSYYGTSTVEQATFRSDNSVFAQLTIDTGPAAVLSMARRLGVRSLRPDKDAVPSIGLGAIAVSPLEMASAYATLAAGGIYSKPTAITKVVLPNGKVDTEAGWGQLDRKPVIADWVAAEVTRVLSENIQVGTPAAAYFGRPSAAKTGTTDNHADAWLCGYTPTLSTVVWMGYTGGEIPMLSVHGIAVAGGTFPAQIWHIYMESVLGNTPPVDFRPASQPPIFRSWVSTNHTSGYVPSYSPGYYSSPTPAPQPRHTAPAPSPRPRPTPKPAPSPSPAPPPTPPPTEAPPPPLPPPTEPPR